MASSTVISGGAIALYRRLVCVARWWSVANERYPQPRQGAGSDQGCGRSLTVAPSTLRMTAAKNGENNNFATGKAVEFAPVYAVTGRQYCGLQRWQPTN